MSTPANAPTVIQQNQCDDPPDILKGFETQLQKMNEMHKIFQLKQSRNVSDISRIKEEHQRLEDKTDLLEREQKWIQTEKTYLEDMHELLVNNYSIYGLEMRRLFDKKQCLEFITNGINVEIEQISNELKCILCEKQLLCSQKTYFTEQIEYFKLKDHKEGVQRNEKERKDIEKQEIRLCVKQMHLSVLIQNLEEKKKKIDDIKDNVIQRLDHIKLMKENIPEDLLKKEEKKELTCIVKEKQILKNHKEASDKELEKLRVTLENLFLQKRKKLISLYKIAKKLSEITTIENKLVFEINKKKKLDTYIKYCWHF